MRRSRSGRTSPSTSSRRTCPTSFSSPRSDTRKRRKPAMRVTQGTFSYLPDFSDEQIDAQIKYSLNHGWAMSIEYTDDIHPRNAYWEMWGLPVFDVKPEDSDPILREVRAAREAYPEHYIKLLAYDPTYTRQTTALSFIVNRPTV